jgi:hypothetical protein
MLKVCARGFATIVKKHRRWVLFNERHYRDLSLGSHADRGPREGSAEIPLGKVEGLVRHLGIDRDCARRVLPQLRF